MIPAHATGPLNSRPVFSPVERVHTSGTGATETAPAGATLVRIRDYGGGGGGARNVSGSGGGGGGGGGFSERTAACVGGDTLTYTVGADVARKFTDSNGNPGNASTVTGALTGGGAISMTANGGAAGSQGGSGGAGGTASGGTTNTTGENGDPAGGSLGGDGGDCLGTGGGIGGQLDGATGAPPGGGGAGSGVSSSGGGARGQVEFLYTAV